jgi:hypothetical protein
MGACPRESDGVALASCIGAAEKQKENNRTQIAGGAEESQFCRKVTWRWLGSALREIAEINPVSKSCKQTEKISGVILRRERFQSNVRRCVFL